MNNIDILSEARAAADWAAPLRQAIHRRPELGNAEFETAALVEKTLTELGWAVRRPFGTAVTALLQGNHPGPCVAFRADMDALPLQEQPGPDRASANAGVMHACGHDVHTAGLLGAAALMARHRNLLHGSVRLLFQPDEEGNGGARRMIEAGCLADPPVSAVFGAHVDPDLPAGSVGIQYGKAYAASDMFTVTIHGRGCHGASPHEGIDAVAVGAQVVCALQQIVSRRVDPTDSAVVTVGSFHAGSAGNIVADTAMLKGILRTLGDDARQAVRRRFAETVSGVCAALGARADVDIVESYPGIVNHRGSVDRLRGVAEGLLGREQVVIIEKPTMGTEDFGYFLRQTEGCFWQLGVRGADPASAQPLHSPRFAPDMAALPVLIGLHFATALACLDGSAQP